MAEVSCPACGNQTVFVDLPEGAAGWRARCGECKHEWIHKQDYFQGELMTCFMCAKQQQSDPTKRSNWRIVEAEGIPYYVCPKHFPDDRRGSAADFKHAYLYVLRKIALKTQLH